MRNLGRLLMLLMAVVLFNGCQEDQSTGAADGTKAAVGMVEQGEEAAGQAEQAAADQAEQAATEQAEEVTDQVEQATNDIAQ